MRISLFEQFRRQYPRACLMTELLVIHQNHYVVRAQVLLEGVLLVTGMAADSVLEAAEDRACLRAMQGLGRPDLQLNQEADSAGISLVESGPGTSSTPLQPAVAQPVKKQDKPAHSPPSLPEPPHSAPPGLEMDPNTFIDAFEADSTADLPIFEVLPELVTDPLTPEGLEHSDLPGQNPASGLATAPNLEAVEPVDLSDIIAQTDVELRRLGWTVAQGREFLERTYGKRSRHDLTDQELLEFLLYLETQSAPVEH